MKNKKSIAMAMAAVSTLGAVAPAFADNVESRILVGKCRCKISKWIHFKDSGR